MSGFSPPGGLSPRARGAAGGVAPLDGTAKVPKANLPALDAADLGFDVATQAELDVLSTATATALGGKAAAADLAALLGVYRYLVSGSTLYTAQAINTAVYIVERGGIASGATNSALGAFYIDPTEWAVSGKTTKLRINLALMANTVAAGMVNIVADLRPVLTWAGGAGAATVATIDTTPTGATVSVAAPAASATARGSSGDFDVPAAGFYVLRVNNDAAMAASSALAIRARLSLRHV